MPCRAPESAVKRYCGEPRSPGDPKPQVGKKPEIPGFSLLLGRCRGWILMSRRGPDGRPRIFPGGVASREAKAIADHRAICTAARPRRLKGRRRVHAGGQTFLPPLSMYLKACSAVQANNRTSPSLLKPSLEFRLGHLSGPQQPTLRQFT